MLWLMEVSRALLEGEITERTAGLLFYGLQMAMVTARWTTFAQTNPAEMVRRADFTAKGAKDAKENRKRSVTTERTEDTEESAEAAEPQAGAPFDTLRAGSAVHTINPGRPPHHANIARTAIPDCAKPAQSGSPGDGDPGIHPIMRTSRMMGTPGMNRLSPYVSGLNRREGGLVQKARICGMIRGQPSYYPQEYVQ
jgi:hypothetical protein